MIRTKNMIIILMVLLSISTTVSAIIGVAHPKPETLELRPGEEGRIEWAIQAIDEKADLHCQVVTKNVNPDLEISYDNGLHFSVRANTIQTVLASVVPLRGLPEGLYEQNFCVECSSAAQLSGVSVKPRFCTPSIVVEVVQERTRNNYPIPSKPGKFESYDGMYAGTAIGILIIVGIALFLNDKRRSKKGGRRPTN